MLMRRRYSGAGLTHGEAKFIVMLGGLHTEMAALRTIGDWLEGSGWTSAITQADISLSTVAREEIIGYSTVPVLVKSTEL